MAKAGRGSDQFPLRLPEGLRDRIKIRAEKSGRSMNAEIVSALEEAFPEGLGIGEFVELHVVNVAKARSSTEKDDLVAAANKAAEAAGSPWRVRAKEGKNGYAAEAYLVDGVGQQAIVTIHDADVKKESD